MKSDVSPGTTLEARYATKKITNVTKPPHQRAALRDTAPNIPSITPNCAEHGTPRARRSVTIMRSFFVSRIRVVIVAMVSHPSPRIIGNTALPLSPIILNILSTIIARRGR